MALQTPVDRLAPLHAPGPRRPSHGAPRKPARLLRLVPDARLVELVRSGSEPAFEVMFDRHNRGILAFCRHMLGSPDEAEDAVQQTFISAYSDLLGSDRVIQLRPWLYTIARNRCVSMLRARRERPADDLEELPTEHLSAAVQRRQDLRDLLRDVVELPEHQRAALMLAEIGGASHDEIAQVLGVDRARVKGLVFQARCSLIASRDARDTPCEEIRGQLMELRGGSLLRTPLRRHLRSCPRCREFRTAVKEQRRMLALALPVAPSVALKAGVMGSAAVGSGAVAGGVGAGVGTAVTAKVLVVAVLAGGSAAGVEVAKHQARGDRAQARSERTIQGRDGARARPAAAAAGLPAADAAHPVQPGWVEAPADEQSAVAAPAPAGQAPDPAPVDARGYRPRFAAHGQAGTPAPDAPAAAPGARVAPATVPGVDPGSRPARPDQPRSPESTRPPNGASTPQAPAAPGRGRGSSGGRTDHSGPGGGSSSPVTTPRGDDSSGAGRGSGQGRSDGGGSSRGSRDDRASGGNQGSGGSGGNQGSGGSGGNSASGRGRSQGDRGSGGSGRSGGSGGSGGSRGSGADTGSGRGRSEGDRGSGGSQQSGGPGADSGSGRGRSEDARGPGGHRGPGDDSGSRGPGVGVANGPAASGPDTGRGAPSDDRGSGGGRGPGNGGGGHGARGSRDDEVPAPAPPPVPPVTVPEAAAPAPSAGPAASPSPDRSGRSGGRGRSGRSGRPAAPEPTSDPSVAPSVAPAASVSPDPDA